MKEKESVLEQISLEGDAAVGFFVKGNRVLIGLRHYKKDEWKEISVWTTPGGGCETGETLIMTLRREIFEEVGIDEFKIISFLGVSPNMRGKGRVFVFELTTDQEVKLMEPDNFSEWQWCPVDQIPDNFISPAALNLLNNRSLK